MDPGPVVALLMMSGASVMDLRIRRVPHLYWLPFVVCAVVLMASRPVDTHLAMAAASALLFLALGHLRLYGGADARALVLTSFLVAGSGSLPMAVLAVAVGSLATLLLPLGYAAWNLTRGDASFPALFLGRRVPLARARRLHAWPMQVPSGTTWRWRYWQRIGTGPDWDGLARLGVDPVWVTPKIPYLVYATFGLAVVLVVDVEGLLASALEARPNRF